MLLANELVAREVKHRRIRPLPRPRKARRGQIAGVSRTTLAMGIHAGDLTHRPELQRLLASIRGKPEEYAIKLALLKSLKRARYAPEPLGHYGLAKATTPTSPARSAATPISSSTGLCAQLLGLTKRGPDATALPSIADHISNTERIAADAENESVKLKKLEFFQNQLSSRRAGKRFPPASWRCATTDCSSSCPSS